MHKCDTKTKKWSPFYDSRALLCKTNKRVVEELQESNKEVEEYASPLERALENIASKEKAVCEVKCFLTKVEMAL